MTETHTEFRRRARAWLEANVPRDPAPRDGPAAREFSLRWQRTQAEGGWAGLLGPGKDYSRHGPHFQIDRCGESGRSAIAGPGYG